MPFPDLFPDIGALPGGAVFHRCALQVNPASYAGQFRGQERVEDGRPHAQAIIEKACDLHISALAITNHNDASEVSDFRDAAAGTDIRIFGGFELESSEGIHILCIYAPDTDDGQLGRYLGQFGIEDPNRSDALSDKTFTEILAMARQQGGVAIAAHATNDKGLLRVLGGQARIKAWRSPDLVAVQIPGPVEDLTEPDRLILRNKNPNYRRAHPVGTELAVAAVNCKDVVTSGDLDHPSASCLIKMAEVSVEGLRQAFLDPGSRIRLNSQAKDAEGGAEMLALAWTGGFLDGTRVRLNPNLNVLVGGRGAGKSTVIESLRYVLDLSPVGEEAGKAHQGIVRQVLRNGTKVSLLVRRRHPARRDYWIERTVPNPPVVRDESGATSNLRPGDVLPLAEVYGQHEISELAKSAEKRTKLLLRFMDEDESAAQRKVALLRGLEKTRRAILDANHELAEIEDRLARLPSLEETLARFQEAGIEERLQERSILIREERVLQSAADRVRPLRELFETLRQQVPVDRLFLSPEAVADLPSKDVLAQADAVLERLNRDLAAIQQRFGAALDEADSGIGEVRSTWQKHKREVQARYEAILRELQRSAVDGAEFIRLRREIEGLRPARERAALLRRVVKEHRERRRDLLREWEDLKATEFRKLEKAGKTASRKLGGRARVAVNAGGNREPLLRLLKERVGGRLSQGLEILNAAHDLSLPDLVGACQRGLEAIQEKYRMPAGPARRLAEAGSETLMLIEELELPSTTDIQLNTAAVGDPPVWRGLEDLSTGQKATAILLLLLLDSDAPLIVDQPEDDLDNRFITDSVVPRMREEKRRRQFVFSTHNANIPVLGDAELILGLTPAGDAAGGSAKVGREHMGSIDTETVRTMLEELLEGGKDAFETRRLKYGF